MQKDKYISYLRVSTARQGDSGLGIEAQRSTVAAHVGSATIFCEYVETESGRKDSRPKLREALAHARRISATLIVAKADRLARSARFLLEILESGVAVEFCDLPQVSGASGRFMLATMANVAELEAGLVSERTKAALAAAKARGVKLGGPNGAAPLVSYIREHGNGAAVAGAVRAADDRAEAWRQPIAEMIADGLGNKAIAAKLNAEGAVSVSGSGSWTATAVRRLRARLGLAGEAYWQAAA